MATLTETAYYTRRTINWIILAIICYIILRIFFGILFALWLYFFPPKPPPPNHRFGKLPALVFPTPTATESAELTFRLESIQGAVPAASQSATVYFMPKPQANLLAINRTQEFAKRLDLNPTPIQQTKNIYRFDDTELVLRRLRYDIVSNNFILRYGFEQDTGLFTDRNLPSAEAALAETKNMLQTYGLYNEDLARGSAKLTFLKLVGDTLVTTTSLSQADSVRVDFFRRNIGQMRVLPPNPDEGSVSVIFSGSRTPKKRTLQFAYTFWPIDYQTTGTYKLKTSAQAWLELQGGGGHIARRPTTGTMAVVRNVSLAYYDSYDPQMYLQPILVFEGDFGFMAYIPAVTPEWVE